MRKAQKRFTFLSIQVIIELIENLIAKAQFRVLPGKKGIRLQENFAEYHAHQLATVASLERAERNPHVANAKGATRWLNPKNQNFFQCRSLPK